MKVFISGPPGVGKTTVFMRVVDMIRGEGFTVGGFICPEVRDRGRRVGFEIVDLMDGSRGWLARLCGDLEEEPRVGRYCVDVEATASIGVKAVEKAISSADLIAVDEVGPMELAVPPLKTSILKVLSGDKPLMAVIHWRLKSELLRLVRGRWELMEITQLNRSHIHRDIYSKIRITLY
ncbi:MAG: NTPase [Zestosphaera sp.]